MTALKRPEREIRAYIPEDFNIKAGWVTNYQDREYRVTWADVDDEEAQWRPAFSWRAFLVRTSVLIGVIAVGCVVVLVGLGFADGVYWAVAHSCGIHIPENP